MLPVLVAVAVKITDVPEQMVPIGLAVKFTSGVSWLAKTTAKVLPVVL